MEAVNENGEPVIETVEIPERKTYAYFAIADSRKEMHTALTEAAALFALAEAKE